MSENNSGDRGMDTAELMRLVKERVRARKEAGVYSDKDIEDVSGSDLPVRQIRASEMLMEQIENLKKDYDFTRIPKITSHRALTGALIVGSKKLLMTMLTKFAAPMWDRQIGFNYNVVQLLEVMAGEIKRLEEENERLRKEKG